LITATRGTRRQRAGGDKAVPRGGDLALHGHGVAARHLSNDDCWILSSIHPPAPSRL
jgi:hypothetical protein